ncbi:glycosyltransferase [Cloacibacillus porcorum]|uniref:glycosyltransferase n=1 Tax=Cloacibacillus porcorum TaxID=1197717 RepID=UPI0026738309|nr:glycosyltransferase [Cloacibacillus porcorum]
MLKVCHMTSVHKRYDGRILKKECVSLVNAGYDVTLIVTDNKEDEIYRGVKITSIDFHPKNRLDRILNSKKRMLKKALNIDADVYHFHDPELIPVGIILHNKGKKVIYDSHEDFVQDIKEKVWIPNCIRIVLSFLFKYYEKISAKNFDMIITVTPHIVDKFLNYHRNVHMITNYPVVNFEDRKNNKRSDCNQICFTGLISPLWEHENIIKALNIMKKDDISYTLAGPSDEDYIKKLKDLDVNKRIKYMGVVDAIGVDIIQTHSVAGMAILKYSQTVGGKIGTLGNTKIFEYMYSQIPVICSDFVLWKEIIDKWKCGICVNPNDIDSISKAITFLKNNKLEAKTMGENGRRAVIQEYNWETQEKKLLALYAQIAGERVL